MTSAVWRLLLLSEEQYRSSCYLTETCIGPVKYQERWSGLSIQSTRMLSSCRYTVIESLKSQAMWNKESVQPLRNAEVAIAYATDLYSPVRRSAEAALALLSTRILKLITLSHQVR